MKYQEKAGAATCDHGDPKTQRSNFDLIEAENINWSVPFGCDANSWRISVMKVAGGIELELTHSGDGLNLLKSQRRPRTSFLSSCLVEKHFCQSLSFVYCHLSAPELQIAELLSLSFWPNKNLFQILDLHSTHSFIPIIIIFFFAPFMHTHT